MRFIPQAIHATSIGIALFFALNLGFDGLWSLNAPSFGIADTARSQAALGLGSLFGLGTVGLLRLAAVIGAFKVAIAAIFALHLMDRLRALFGHSFDHESLDAGLIMVTALTIVTSVPALLAGNTTLIANYSTILLLAGVAALLSAVERLADEPSAIAVSPTEPSPIKPSPAQPL